MQSIGAICFLIVVLCSTHCWTNPAPVQCGKPADVVFVIDTSSSIWPRDFDLYVLTFIQNVVNMFNVGPGSDQTRVGAVTFSNDVKLEFNLNSHHTQHQLQRAIGHIKFRGGNTYTDKALKYVTDNMFLANRGGRSDVMHIVIVLTDGKSSKQEQTFQEAENARRSGAAVFAIGVGEAEDSELVKIASQPSNQFKFKVTDFAALDSIKMELALKACEVSLPPTPATTTTSTTTTTTTTTTQLPPREECGGRPADIFFILDSSSSIWKLDFEKRMLGFVRELIANFDIGPELTRVGVITFNDNPQLVIGLDSYLVKHDLLEAIHPRVIRYSLGGTNTAEALRDVRKIGFHQSLLRAGVDKIAIVITDGQSWNEKKTAKEAALLRDSGVKVYAIGVGKGVKQEELESIANEPSENFVFSVDDFGALSEIRDVLAVKACGQNDLQSDQPVCGSGPVDITFALDGSTQSMPGKLKVLDQIQDVTKRLSYIGGQVKLAVTAGPCPPSLDMALSSPETAAHKLRRIRREVRPNLLGVVKQWRYKTVGDLKKTSSEAGLTQYDGSGPSDGSRKGLVLLLNRENSAEFNHLSEEVLLLIDAGVDVLVVAEDSVSKKDIDRWVDLVGHRRVLSGVDPRMDYSGYLTEFICSL